MTAAIAENLERKMNSRDEVLKLLREKDDFVSGERMAEQLHLSRNSIWKAIQSLKKQGYRIDAVTHRGYYLVRDSFGKKDPEQNRRLERSEILSYLDPDIRESMIHVFDEVDSTNTLAKRMAVEEAVHGTAVIAGRQSGGRAHHAEQFYSPDGGIYLSLILDPGKFKRTDPNYFSETTAVAVLLAIRKVCGIQTEIRKRNDLYYRNKKICGILNETVMDLEDSDMQWIVAGIGVHFAEKETEFPPQLRPTTGSLYPDGNAKTSISQLAAEIVNEFLNEKYGSPEEVRTVYRQYHV